MPWARDMERALAELRRENEALKSGSLANNRAAATANLTNQTIQATVTETATVAQAAAEQVAIKGTTWAQDTMPPTGKAHFWEGAVNNSISVAVVDGIIVGRNLYRNPSFETVMAPSTFVPGAGGAGTPTIVNDGSAPAGSSFVRGTWSTMPTVLNNNGFNLGTVSGIVAGEAYSAAVSLRTSKPQRMALYMQFVNAAGSNIGNNQVDVILEADTWTRVEALERYAPAETTSVRLLAYQVTGEGSVYWNDGDTLDVDAVMLNQGAEIEEYFDGSSPSDRANDLWINTTGGKNVNMRWDNGTWVSVQDGSIREAITLAEEAITKSVSAAVLRIDSSNGNMFKNSEISTTLNVTIYYAGSVIVDFFTLRDMIGPGAYLEWYWRREDDTQFSVISAGDTRLSNAGFSLTVSPADVDEKTIFQCILHD